MRLIIKRDTLRHTKQQLTFAKNPLKNFLSWRVGERDGGDGGRNKA